MINYLLTESAFRAVKYWDLSLYAQTPQARSTQQDHSFMAQFNGLNILPYEKKIQLTNSN